MLTVGIIITLGILGTVDADRNIGCYQDGNDNDDMAMSIKTVFESDNGLDKCTEYCKQYHYTFLGLKNGKECHCGEDYARHGRSSTCNMKCPNSDSEICGGSSSLSVYSVCPKGKYGSNCEYNCSSQCTSDVCNLLTGQCCVGSFGESCNFFNKPECGTISGDPRDDNYFGKHLNDAGGPSLNLFTNLTFKQFSRVTKVKYYSQKSSGIVFLSIWRKLSENRWMLVGKIVVSPDNSGTQIVHLGSNAVFVQPGDAVGVHYPANPSVVGIIPYERSDKDSWSTTGPSINLLYEVISMGNNPKIGNLEPGGILDTGSPEINQLRTAPIEFFYDCIGSCKSGSFGTSCSETCSNCKANEPCHHENGACPLGCKMGYVPPICDTACSENTYGENCSHSCGHCFGGSPCYNVDGTCTSCSAGYMGELCTEECAEGKYGENCINNCPINCKRQGCNTIDGTCKNGCIPGYQGQMCNIECNNNKYGMNCEFNCSGHCKDGVTCNHINGDCSNGCDAGFHGGKCESECSSGFYGNNCHNKCSGHCKNNDTCDKKTGNCPSGCMEGWHGDMCNSECENNVYGANCDIPCGNCAGDQCDYKSGVCPDNLCETGYTGNKCDTECQGNTYGQNCTRPCHCVDGHKCNHVTGFCTGGCATGWSGNDCSLAVDESEFDDRKGGTNGNTSNNSAIIGGALGGFLFLLIILIIILVVLIRRKKGKHTYYENALSQESESAGNPVFSEPDSPSTKVGDNPAAFNITEVKDHLVKSKPPVKPKVAVKPTVVTEPLTDNPYKNVASGKIPIIGTRIPVQDIGKYIAGKNKDEGPFSLEFQDLPIDKHDSWDYCGQEDLKPKNRFKNIMPYDKNRVILEVKGNNPLSDYINASYIQDYRRSNAYIASHGPNKFTLDDFWRMIWEQNIELIFMVTNLVERSKTKCEQYWPLDKEVTYGDVKIVQDQEETFAKFTIRHLTIQKGTEERKIKQYHYTSWPDHGVPENSVGVMTLREEVRAYRQTHDVPVVIHCSAGVGRTGTLIALDILMDQAKEENAVDVFNCVKSLRLQRVNMVQSLEQYKFIYNALHETLSVGQTNIAGSEFIHQLTELQKKDDSGQSKLEKQFKFLEEIKPTLTDAETEFARQEDNISKNRDTSVLPSEKYRCVLASDPNTYINAVQVDGYQQKNIFIATQIPMESTAEDFWRLVTDFKCGIIINLDDSEWLPEPEKQHKMGTYNVKVEALTSANGIEQFEMSVIEQSEVTSEAEYANVTKMEEISIKVFSAKEWTTKPLMERDGNILINIHSEVQKWQQHSKYKKTVVLCKNGAVDTGLYIAASYLFDMANSEQEVDILQVVKHIRATRPQFIIDVEQYQFLHLLVKEYLKGFTEYANFK